MDKEEILYEIEKTKQHLANMEKTLKEHEYERWKPKELSPYFYVDSCMKIEQSNFYNDTYIHYERYNTYSIFRTRKQAKAEVEKILVRRMLEDIARRLNKGRKIDWESESPRKYYLCIDRCNYIYSNVCYSTKYQGTVYCLDKNFRDIAIQKIGEERLKVYLRGE